MKSIALLAACSAFLVAGLAMADEPLRVLYLTKSSGFQHSVVARDGEELAHSEKILIDLGKDMGAEVTVSKDATLINTDELHKYDVVVFYTTGDLTDPGTDKTPAMSQTGFAELEQWVESGGGFVGLHAATDTFRSGKEGEPTPYTKFIGAEFLNHGKQFEGVLKNVAPEHPAMTGIPAEMTVLDEWYLFANLQKDSIHVLALLDPADERGKQEMYDIPAYPMIWCSALGQGRIYFNGMGHREDVWESDPFKQMLRNAIHWVAGEGPTDAEPNYAEVTALAADAELKSEAPAE
jgi:type 1 glutamine amidotransferase